MRELLDKGLDKFISRKLFAFSVATILLCTGHLTAEWWGFICTAYVGGQSFVDVVGKIKGR